MINLQKERENKEMSERKSYIEKWIKENPQQDCGVCELVRTNKCKLLGFPYSPKTNCKYSLLELNIVREGNPYTGTIESLSIKVTGKSLKWDKITETSALGRML